MIKDPQLQAIFVALYLSIWIVYAILKRQLNRIEKKVDKQKSGENNP